WERRLFPEAAELYRQACCLEERGDQFAEAYVRAARGTEQVPEAPPLVQLKARRAPGPAPPAPPAPFPAPPAPGEPAPAFASLDQAVRKLQESGVSSQKSEVKGPVSREPDSAGATAAPHAALAELLLFRAESHAHFGRFDQAGADLTAARPVAPPGSWHR